MNRPRPTAPLLCFALSLCACGTDTRLRSGVLDAGRDARIDDAASPDGSHAQSDGSAGHDADVAKEPCDAACKGATPHCDVAADACVACTGDQHCEGDPNNSHCVQGACVPCETNEHCQGITNGSVALGVCDQGACVECTSEHAEACLMDGTQYVCDPQRNTCDPKRKARSKTLCNNCIPTSNQDCTARPECISDMECQPGQACVLVAAGNGIAVCQKIADDAPCPRPYAAVTKTPAITADGNSVRVCTFATETTCQAHADYRKKRCGTPKQGDPNDVDVEGTADNALCGAEGLNDGYCVFSEGFKQYLCSVPCSNNVSDCPAINPSASCDNVAPDLAVCSL